MQTIKPVSASKAASSRKNRSRFALKLIIALVFGGMTLWFWDTLQPFLGIIAEKIQLWQDNTPAWLGVPAFSSSNWLYLPALLAWGIAQSVMMLSPQQQFGSRLIIVGLILLLSLRYVLWRSLTTLNLSDPITGLVSLGLWAIEIATIAGTSIQLVGLLRIKSRRRQADFYAQSVIEGHYRPTVDILIPSLNEPVAIVRRTIIGCQALDYPFKAIYLCDDGERPEIAALCQELGCIYLARSDHAYAKAGNLNFAIAQSTGELILVFDADFIPTHDFLTRTVGFFQNPEMGLVQSHHSFYNTDALAYNLGRDRDLTSDIENFYRYYQPLRDGTGTAFCSGSSFVVRRSALEQVGGFVCGTLSEDYYTGIKLAAQGFQVIYLQERLSAGLLAESISDNVQQRQRWARGTIQSFFIPSNPLTIPGLTFFQRITHFEGISHWFTSIYRAIFLILPPFLIFMQIIPVRASTEEWIYYFIPFYCVQLSTLGWLSFRSHSAFFGDVYQVISCLPISIAILKTLVSPFAARFRVTPKGISQRFFSYHWRLALPLLIVLVLTLGAYLKTALFPIRCESQSCLAHQSNIGGIELIIAFFAIYNLLVLSIAIIGLIEVPKVSVAQIGYGIATPVILQVGEQNYRSMTRQLSERWAEIDLETGLENEVSLTGSLINTVFSEENLCLGGIIQQSVNHKNGTLLRIEWEPMAIAQYRRLVEIIFCKPGRWQQQENPGELKTIGLLVSHLFYPVRLFAQSRRALGAVSQKTEAS